VLVVAEGVAVEEAGAAGSEKAKRSAAALALGVVGGGGKGMVEVFRGVASIVLLYLCGSWWWWWWCGLT